MEKIWFIQVDGKKEGPFSLEELKKDWRINPDTLVWRKGFKRWMPIRRVRELKKVFEDTTESPKDLGEILKIKKVEFSGKDTLAIDFNRESPPLLFWILMTIIVVSYLMYRLSERS